MSQPPLTASPTPTCASCRFWQHTPGQAISALLRVPTGECRAGRPTGNYTFPRTHANAWCGQWEPLPGNTTIPTQNQIRRHRSAPATETLL
jgi:hypothetical protein